MNQEDEKTIPSGVNTGAILLFAFPFFCYLIGDSSGLATSSIIFFAGFIAGASMQGVHEAQKNEIARKYYQKIAETDQENEL